MLASRNEETWFACSRKPNEQLTRGAVDVRTYGKQRVDSAVILSIKLVKSFTFFYNSTTFPVQMREYRTRKWRYCRLLKVDDCCWYKKYYLSKQSHLHPLQLDNIQGENNFDHNKTMALNHSLNANKEVTDSIKY